MANQLTEKEQKLLEIAQRILAANKHTAISGTLMLKLRGIDLGREAKDLDIIYYGAPYGFNMPFLEAMPLNTNYEGEVQSYEIAGERVDIVPAENGNEFDSFVNLPNAECQNKTINLALVEDLMGAKENYIEIDCSDTEKHKQDLEILKSLGYGRPQ